MDSLDFCSQGLARDQQGTEVRKTGEGKANFTCKDMQASVRVHYALLDRAALHGRKESDAVDVSSASTKVRVPTRWVESLRSAKRDSSLRSQSRSADIPAIAPNLNAGKVASWLAKLQLEQRVADVGYCATRHRSTEALARRASLVRARAEQELSMRCHQDANTLRMRERFGSTLMGSDRTADVILEEVATLRNEMLSTVASLMQQAREVRACSASFSLLNNQQEEENCADSINVIRLQALEAVADSDKLLLRCNLPRDNSSTESVHQPSHSKVDTPIGQPDHFNVIRGISDHIGRENAIIQRSLDASNRDSDSGAAPRDAVNVDDLLSKVEYNIKSLLGLCEVHAMRCAFAVGDHGLQVDGTDSHVHILGAGENQERNHCEFGQASDIIQHEQQEPDGGGDIWLDPMLHASMESEVSSAISSPSSFVVESAREAALEALETSDNLLALVNARVAQQLSAHDSEKTGEFA